MVPSLYGGSADLAPSNKSYIKNGGSICSNDFTGRNIHFGIREHGMAGVLNGMALYGGIIPYGATFLVFSDYMRPSIRLAAMMGLQVIYIFSHDSIFVGEDGPTHHAEADIAIMRSLPNMTVVEAADAIEAKKMVPVVAEYDGPVYLRISRAETPVLFDENHEVEIGKGVVVRDGNDVTLIACGVMVSRCLEAAKTLASEGVDARVVNMHTIKPLDVSLVKKAAEETGAIVTAEEHSVIGGLGSAVAEVLGEKNPIPLERVGIHDTFTETSLNHEELLDHYGMGIKDIIKATRHVMKRS